MGSPGAMSPVAFATPSTPHLNLGCSCFMIMARFNPFWKRSIQRARCPKPRELDNC